MVSSLSHYLFTAEVLPIGMDFLGCYKYDKHGKVVQARSRLMRHQQNEFQMDSQDLKIPRPKVTSLAIHLVNHGSFVF